MVIPKAKIMVTQNKESEIDIKDLEINIFHINPPR
jgi:hypothetical protein